MKQLPPRDWLTLESAAERLVASGISATPDDVLHLAGKGQIRAYVRLKQAMHVEATRIALEAGKVPRIVVAGGGVILAFVRLTRRASALLEVRGAVEVETIVQGNDDPLEAFEGQDPELRWKPTEPLIASSSDVVVLAGEIAAIATPRSSPGGDEAEGATAQHGARESPSAGWPWGSHETKLLAHFSQAGKKWWSNYDPDDPSTAPRNKQVVNWLTARGVGQRTAEIMATILRADDLPSGRR